MSSVDSAAFDAHAQLLIGGRYAVQSTLGKGGAAHVYRVEDRALATTVALKRLSPDASPKLATLFELEYRTLASIQHPRVVRALDFGRDRGGAYYTMELLEGADLREVAPAPFPEVCRYLRDAAQALSLLHARRFVHRDVSPRNLWRTPDGRVKLIDFGALASFGRNTQLIGTPPCLAPEALYGHELDPRTDLFALGAVAYYLLTRAHAYDARDMGELPELWQRPLAPPSQRVAALARPELPSVPSELDELVLALLSPNVLARPAHCAEVMARLDVLVGRPDHASAERLVTQSILENPAYVGQHAARRSLRRQLSLARAGRGRGCLLEAQPGSGRSRTLRELALEAQLADGVVLHARPVHPDRAFDTASTLAVQLLRALPGPARHAAGPHIAALALLSPQAAEALDRRSDGRGAAREARVRILSAFHAWIAELTRDRLLVVLVDDVERLDDASLALLIGLVELARGRKLLVVCSAALVPRAQSASERALRAACHRTALRPFREDEALALLHAIFGEVKNVERLAVRLFRVSRGNPGHIVELCKQLLARDLISYVDGLWLLPAELAPELLSTDRIDTLLARLSTLNADSRDVARLLSVNAGPIPLELARAVVELRPHATFASLHALLEAGVLIRESNALVFAQEELRCALREELPAAAGRRAHGVVGTFLLERAASALERLHAGLHLLEGGEGKGAEVVARAARHITLHDTESVSLAAPLAERALRLLRATGVPERHQVSTLALLVLAGYAADPRYAQYGGETVAALERLLYQPLAGKLRPYLGSRLSLLVALAAAALSLGRHRKSPAAPSLKEAIALLFSAVGAMVGTFATCLDPERARSAARVLEPFRALGPNHVACAVYESCVAVSETARDKGAETHAKWRTILARLDDQRQVRGLTMAIRRRFTYAACTALGIIEAQRDHPNALLYAERLDGATVDLGALGSAQVRMLYYANRGELEHFERERARAEQLAVQLGTSWQMETWTPSARTLVGFRTRDVVALKEAAEQLERLSQQIPSLHGSARRAYGMYLAVSGQYAEAVQVLAPELNTRARDYAAWTRTLATLAASYNLLSEHRRAREVCEHVDAHSTGADVEFGGAILMVERERLIADAALGGAAEAYDRLAARIEQHAAGGSPLAVGDLHDAAITVALLRDDLSAARAHYVEMERHYLATRVPSLAQHCQRRQRQLDAIHPSRVAAADVASEARESARPPSAETIERRLAGGNLTHAERAERALGILAEQCLAERVYVYLLLEDESVVEACLPATQVVPAEIRERLVRTAGALDVDEDTQVVDGDDGGKREPRDFVLDGGYFRMAELCTGRLRGCAALGSSKALPQACSSAVIQAVFRQLARAPD